MPVPDDNELLVRVPMGAVHLMPDGNRYVVATWDAGGWVDDQRDALPWWAEASFFLMGVFVASLLVLAIVLWRHAA